MTYSPPHTRIHPHLQAIKTNCRTNECVTAAGTYEANGLTQRCSTDTMEPAATDNKLCTFYANLCNFNLSSVFLFLLNLFFLLSHICWHRSLCAKHRHRLQGIAIPCDGPDWLIKGQIVQGRGINLGCSTLPTMHMQV